MIKQSTSTNSVPRNAVGGAEVSCQMYNVDRDLKELNVQYVFEIHQDPRPRFCNLLLCLFLLH
eukprot:747254-Hanusia_phi.AAC.1